MLAATMRAARPLRIQSQTFAVASRAQPSVPFTTRTPSSSRLGRGKISPFGPLQTTFRARSSTKPPLQPNKIDREHEKEVAQKKLESRPDEVTSSSTVRQVFEESQAPAESNPDIMVGLKSDLNTVKDTFALASVPREAFGLGLAGTLPYLATSLSTVVLSWNLNMEWPTQSSFINAFLFNHEAAAHWLHILEPIQVGYGAVIISFLGAIHWGLEFGERQAAEDRTRLRYGIGVLAPAVAWPTIYMPIEWALTTQFAAFCALYFTDSRATVKGWAPAWYGSYRFVLTAVVGGAILISLIGRAKVGEGANRLTTGELAESLKTTPSSGDKSRDWSKEEEEERERIHKEQKKEEEEKKQKAEEEKKAKEKDTKEGEAKKEGGAKSKEQDAGDITGQGKENDEGQKQG
ncbi:uncharacterized protein B0H64DRAFT_389103 [Chaetomium fimeti]|uniref:Mitochondrial inner membrane protein 1 protein n=1 Tax=Chaetomium fimeti TaxID=1854472 RepID=A0AAE0LVZ4_9PEZI|nr:hypothetical protein B0H64DRAFT_389103 [Chaetomium fimeti]